MKATKIPKRARTRKKKKWDFPVRQSGTKQIFTIKRPGAITDREHIIRPGAIKNMIARARDIEQELGKVKPLYNELDQITTILMEAAIAGIDLSKHGAVLVDRFATKNTAFKTVAISRFQLEWRKAA